jgi:beta-ribofuranosylaminobenzene 5'-phosphate synthase
MKETDMFKIHCPVPLDEVQVICHEILMRMLPGIIEHDLELFGSSVNMIQSLGFKKVELGLQPKQIPDLIELMRSSGAACAGMSSFGPTVFAIDDTDMQEIEQAAQSFMNDHGGGSTLITSARNKGATVRIV